MKKSLSSCSVASRHGLQKYYLNKRVENLGRIIICFLFFFLFFYIYNSAQTFSLSGRRFLFSCCCNIIDSLLFQMPNCKNLDNRIAHFARLPLLVFLSLRGRNSPSLAHIYIKNPQVHPYNICTITYRNNRPKCVSLLQYFPEDYSHNFTHHVPKLSTGETKKLVIYVNEPPPLSTIIFSSIPPVLLCFNYL